MKQISSRLCISLQDGQFFRHLREGSWHRALHMIGQNTVSIKAFDEWNNNVFNHAAAYVFSDRLQMDQLVPLISNAFECSVEVRIDYAFYMNPLHILARGKENDESLYLLRKLLERIDSIYLNAYNKFGKTPLLEAISKGNTETALALLEQPGTDVNLFKIHSISISPREIYNIKHGSSAFDAACSLQMNEKVVKCIQTHRTYKQGLSYVYPDSGDIIRREHFLFAEQGNVDTLKVLFKNHDAKALMCVDDLFWTMLHIACFAANLPVVEFLLNKSELDAIVGSNIPEDLYTEFVNRRTDLFSTALDRVLCAAGQMYDMKIKDQIPLFINCPYFKVNDGAYNWAGDGLIHYIAKNNLTDLMLALTKRDVNFDEENMLGQTALEAAAVNGHHDMVKLLSDLVTRGKAKINPNRYSRKCKLLGRLRFYMEEEWFGHVSFERLTADDLIEIYRTKESKEVKITHFECIIDNVTSDTITSTDMELIKQHLEYYFHHKCNDLISILLSSSLKPAWFDTNLYEQIADCWNNTCPPPQGQRDLNINGARCKVTWSTKQVTTECTMEYEHLCTILRKDKSDDRAKMLSADYISLLATVVDQAQNEKDVEVKENLVKVIKVLVNFPKVKLNILVIKGGKVCYIDDIIKASEIKTIFATARSERKKEKDKAKKKQERVVSELRANDTALRKFAIEFIYKIETLNIERQFHLCADEQQRRTDALARLFEVDGICAAVYFNGKDKFFFATNPSNQAKKADKLKQDEVIKDTISYFAETANGKVQVTVRRDLICCMVQGKMCRSLKQKQSAVLDKVAETIKSKITELERILLKERLCLDRYGVLTASSFKKVLERCDLAAYTEMNKTDSGGEAFKAETFSNYVNAMFKFFIRYLLDFKIIEDYINSNPKSEFVLALKDKSWQSVGEDEKCHAEMKVISYILGTLSGSDTLANCYIGISKLCCAHCNLVLNNCRTSKGIMSRGAHGEDFEWILPSFMKTVEGFEKVFYSDQSFCRLFDAAHKENAECTLQFIEKYSVLKDAVLKGSEAFDIMYESLARNTRNQEQDWSDFDSTQEHDLSDSEDLTFHVNEKLSLQEGSQGLKHAGSYLTELGLTCQDVQGDGFCLFRAIAMQFTERYKNDQEYSQFTDHLIVLQKVITYFCNHTEELMRKVYPPPSQADLGPGVSEEEFESKLNDYEENYKHNFEKFCDSFDRYTFNGEYHSSESLNAADWIPQVLDEIFKIDIDIIDGDLPGSWLHTENGYTHRIGLGRINNNHYVSLNGNLETAYQEFKAKPRK